MADDAPKTPDDIYRFLNEHWPRINRNAAEVIAHKAKLAKEGKGVACVDQHSTKEQLLADLHAEANDDQTRHGYMTVSLTTAKFASLLVLLSNEAEKTTRRLTYLAWATFGLTIAALVVAVIQAVLAYVQLNQG